MICVHVYHICNLVTFYFPRLSFSSFYLPLNILKTRVLEKEMATHSSIFAWRIPQTEEAGGL